MKNLISLIIPAVFIVLFISCGKSIDNLIKEAEQGDAEAQKSLSLASTQENASDILNKAYVQAKEENKNVFVIFHASWCGWCKRMDKNMNDDSCRDLFARNYVITHLVVRESEENKHLENPGADEVLKKYKGEKSGIPFWLIFDKDGKLLEDSFNSAGQNLGCPATGEEVSEFVSILKNTSDMTEKELEIVALKFHIRE